MGAEQRGSPLCLRPRGEREEKSRQSEPSAAFDGPWEEAGEPRGLASSAGVRGGPVGLYPAACQGGMRCYRVNLLVVCAWRHLPQPERPDGPWEDTAQASVTGVKHRCRAQDKRWGDGVGGGAAVDPDMWAGAALLPE